MDPVKVIAFLPEYRDLVHRHGLGLVNLMNGAALSVGAVTDADPHVADIQYLGDARVAGKRARRGPGEQSA